MHSNLYSPSVLYSGSCSWLYHRLCLEDLPHTLMKPGDHNMLGLKFQLSLNAHLKCHLHCESEVLSPLCSSIHWLYLSPARKGYHLLQTETDVLGHTWQISPTLHDYLLLLSWGQGASQLPLLPKQTLLSNHSSLFFWVYIQLQNPSQHWVPCSHH